MNCKFSVRKSCRIAAIILVVLVGIYFLYAALFLPSEFNKLTQSRKAEIESRMRITVPASARFIEGYTIPGRDPTHIFLLELNLSEKESGETSDQFFRRMLCIKDEDYGATWLSVAEEDVAQLEELGYTFQWGITCRKDPFIKIYYRETDAGKLQTALILGTS